MKKRQIPKPKQYRNLLYLVLIAMALLLALNANTAPAWLIFMATAYYFWPAGHYGKRGVR